MGNIALLGAGTAGGSGLITDPFFANVVLLAGFNGADGATTYNEEKNGRAVSFGGNAQLDDAQFKFGTTSLRVDGTGDVATLADNADWQFASTEAMEYTLEMWVRFNSITNANHMLFGQSNSVGTLATQCFIPSGNLTNLTYNHFHNGSAGGGVTTTSGGLATGQWFWIAVTKNASKKLRVRINGVMRGTFTLTTGTMFDSGQTLALGSNSGNSIGMDGWIDEVRFTKGVDRYDTDSDVAVPTVAWPRS